MSFSWQERTLLLMGEEKLGKLASSVVAVIGLGGVGAYAAEMLARAGVGRMILLDSDNIAESNKNRQLLALDSNMGRKKVEVMAERLKDINPSLELTLIDEYLTSDNVADLLGPFKLDYLVDAIDTLSPKLSLIQYCVNAGIPHVTSMGAGAKYDATKVRMTDLSKSRNCPLAFIVRKKLRKMGIEKGFPVVYSEELPDNDAIVETKGETNKKSQVGTISYLPAVFGCICAQAAITHIIDMD